MNQPLSLLRAHRAPLAWMLLALILFNGLACSLGHGLMLKAFAPDAHSVEHGSHHDMSGHHAVDMTQDTSQDMKGGTPGMFETCAFAATLTMALVAFIALGWLLPHRPDRCSPPDRWHSRPARHCSSGLNPHAP